MDAQTLAQWQGKYRDAVQSQLSEPVEAAWAFYRSGSFAAMGLRQISPIVAWGVKAMGKRKAGGLPQNFLLAVTPTRVYAFEYKASPSAVKIGKELAVWERNGLRVTSEAASINTTVTLESAAEAESVVCSTGKDEASLAMIRALAAPVAA